MKEWFKARNIWGAAITAMSDEEAGRLAKAIWTYTMTGERLEIEGAGKGIFALILMTLSQDEERDAEISEKRSRATDSIRKQKASNDTACVLLTSNDIKTNQMISNDDNKNKNKNKNIDKEQESESFISDGEAQKIQSEQNRVFDAALDAGFGLNNSVRASLIRLYANYGLEKMLEGFTACVKYGASNLAYLEAVLKGEPKKAKPKVGVQDYGQRDYSGSQDEILDRQKKEFESRIKGKKVLAQQYEQRDYSGVQDELMAQQDREMEEFMRRRKEETG